MKLIQLKLTAFRQYKHKVFDFTDGITTIVGPNGSGKSTIIEALGFALFGSIAIRGTVKDAICLSGGSLQVDLTFALDSEYTISRTVTKASLSGEVQAEGTTEVNKAVKELLGMDYSQFCNSFMTNQKALKFLDITPDKRRSTVMSILGLDRILQGYKRAYKDVSEQTALLKGMGNVAESSTELKHQIKVKTEELEVLKSNFQNLQEQYTAYLNYQKNYQRIQQLQSDIIQAKRADEILAIDGWKDASERERIYLRALDDKEIDTITRDEAFSEELFFDEKGRFLHDRFGNYMLSNCNIVRIDGLVNIYTKDHLYSNNPDEFERKMVDRIAQLKDTQRKEVYKYIALQCKKTGEFASPKYVGLKSEILDLETKQAFPYSPEWIINNRIDFDYKEDAYDLTMDRTLDKVCCFDSEVRALFEEMLGYTLYRKNSMQVCFI
ncbi:MAG: hypothetical protein EOM67_13480, partial [Spirochaetia bacterium]|nr:hypothetical protein [Spirochaetia bacterium]